MGNKPNLSVGRGEKLSVSKGGGLTAKGKRNTTEQQAAT
jgi:hypothetical protein